MRHDAEHNHLTPASHDSRLSRLLLAAWAAASGKVPLSRQEVERVEALAERAPAALGLDPGRRDAGGPWARGLASSSVGSRWMGRCHDMHRMFMRAVHSGTTVAPDARSFDEPRGRGAPEKLGGLDGSTDVASVPSPLIAGAHSADNAMVMPPHAAMIDPLEARGASARSSSPMGSTSGSLRLNRHRPCRPARGRRALLVSAVS
jgi:hypothetical protein